MVDMDHYINFMLRHYLIFLWRRSGKEKQMLRQSLQEITLEQIEKLKKKSCGRRIC